jgi:uncharacterized YccA/Bax inhibitor family protein
LTLNQLLFSGQTQTLSIAYKGFTFTTSVMTVIFAAVASVLAIVTQLIAAFVPASIPVTGTVYSMCQGFIISFLVFTVIKGYEYLGLLALAITVVVVFTMSILYTTGVIRVTKKFKMVMLTLLITSIAVSILMFIGSFIPFTQPLVAAIRQNLGFSIGVSVVFILIAALFLICDFDTIDHVVNDKLPKKYEWAAAFGLAFTVLWIYLKVLDIIMTIAGNKRD